MDLIVEREVVLELKAIEKILPVHEAQLLTYLKLSDGDDNSRTVPIVGAAIKVHQHLGPGIAAGGMCLIPIKVDELFF